MVKKGIFTFILGLCSLLCFSQVPGTLSYQGLLLDASNNPVPDGSNTITFRFYNVETGGTYDATIGERTLSVQTFKGLFTAILGDGAAGNPALPSLVGSQQYWIGVTPVGGSELSPRVRLSTVPYAFRAQTVNAVDAATITSGTVPNAQLDTDLQDLADGSLSGSLVGSGINGANVGTGINASNITTGTVAVANGGTGATSAVNARAALGLTIGTNVQAYDADLDDIADGSLTGSKVGTGITATNVTTGTLPNTVLDADLQDLADGTLSGATLSLAGTDASKLATGTTAQRPVSPVEGQIRYNSTQKVMEYYNGTNWYFMVPKVAFLKDEKTPSLDAGTSFSGTWTKRDLNTQSGDLTAIVLLSGNNFTLSAGEYFIEASAPMYRGDYFRIRLWDTTNGAVALDDQGKKAVGSSEFTYSVLQMQTRCNLMTKIVVTSNTVFEIQQYVYTGQTGQGLGVGTSGSGENEVYTQVKITKLR